MTAQICLLSLAVRHHNLILLPFTVFGIPRRMFLPTSNPSSSAMQCRQFRLSSLEKKHTSICLDTDGERRHIFYLCIKKHKNLTE